MSPNSSEIYVELEAKLYRLVGLTGLSHNLAANALIAEDESSSPEEREALANVIHTEMIVSKKLLSDFLKAMQREDCETTGNKKALN